MKSALEGVNIAECCAFVRGPFNYVGIVTCDRQGECPDYKSFFTCRGHCVRIWLIIVVLSGFQGREYRAEVQFIDNKLTPAIPYRGFVALDCQQKLCQFTDSVWYGLGS